MGISQPFRRCDEVGSDRSCQIDRQERFGGIDKRSDIDRSASSGQRRDQPDEILFPPALPVDLGGARLAAGMRMKASDDNAAVGACGS